MSLEKHVWVFVCLVSCLHPCAPTPPTQAAQLVPAEFTCCATLLHRGSWWGRPCGREGSWDDTSFGNAGREGLSNRGTPPFACADDLTLWVD